MKFASSDGITPVPLTREHLASLAPRPADGHKGTFGRIAVIGGAVGMSGAAYLAAKAAYRAGAGIVEIFCPEENRVIYQTLLPEAVLTLYDNNDPDLRALHQVLKRADAVALGMGLGTDRLCRDFLHMTLTYCDKPLVLDADALNLLSCSDEHMRLLVGRGLPTVLTPHVGEAARLLHSTVADIKKDPIAAALTLAQNTNSIVALKDAKTLITDGTTLYCNTFGNNGMATGGSGDVLAGIISAFTVRNSALTAATLGVLTHALAGDAAAKHCGTHGTMASDIIDGLRQILP